MNLTSKTPKIELLLRLHQILDLEETEHRMAIECKSGVPIPAKTRITC
jgi:hypothetical protein